MGVDLSVFGRQKSVLDYQQLQQAFEQKKALQMAQLGALQSQAVNDASGGNLPAAIQIANEFQKARAEGNTQRMNDIAMAAKSFDKGVNVNQSGGFGEMEGYGAAAGNIAAQKAGMVQQAEKNVDFNMNPQIKRAESQESAIGTAAGVQIGNTQKQAAQAGGLIDTLDDIDRLLPDATGGGLNTKARDLAAYFNVATSGAATDASLKTLASKVLQSVPRFEGPQGVLDVKIYQQAAGQLDDSTLPISVRQAAAGTLREIMERNAAKLDGAVPTGNDAKRQRLDELRAKKAGGNG